MKPIILCFADYYLPGHKAGGPIRSVANLVDVFYSEFDFLIVARDRDFLDAEPFPDVLIDQWNNVGNAKVFYASPKMLSVRGIYRLLNETPHDALYLNSFLV
jgi:hypothetical protein